MAHRWDPRAPQPPPLVRPVPIDPTGVNGPTRDQASGRYWRRTSRGLYVPVDVDDDIVEQRILEQSMTLPPDGAVTGWGACRLHGANFCDGLDQDGRTRLPVPLDVGPRGHIAPRSGARLVFRPVLDADRATRYGIATVSIERAAYDAVLLAPDLTEAVVAIDVVCAAELMSVQMLREYAARQRFRKSKVDAALPHASEHPRSPNEVRLRMLLTEKAGLARLLVNCPIHDLSGRLLGIADLLDLEAGLVIEFNGADHRGAIQQTADTRKEAALRGVGLEVAGVTGLDLRDDELVVSRILAARSRALFQPEPGRRWVAHPPADNLHSRLLARRALQEQHAWIESQPTPDIRELRGW